MNYVVGLGNPEKKYQQNRHNIGFLALDFLVHELGLPGARQSSMYEGLYTSGTFKKERFDLLYPQTFMNHSGRAVIKLVKGENRERLVVVYDDLALPFGEVRISFGRGDGGHNGIKSIIDSLKSKDFVRVRIGIAPLSFWTGKIKIISGDQVAKYVLADFSKKEQLALQSEIFPKVKEMILSIATTGREKAMNRFN